MEVRIIKELVVSGEWRGIREERNDEEFSPQRTQRAQRWGEEGERKETGLKVEARSPDQGGAGGAGRRGRRGGRRDSGWFRGLGRREVIKGKARKNRANEQHHYNITVPIVK